MTVAAKQKIVKQGLAVNFLDNLLDVALNNPQNAPKNFADQLVKKIAIALKQQSFCNKIMDGEKTGLPYDEEESGILTALTPHLNCLYNKHRSYASFLVGLNYNAIVPTDNHTATIIKSPIFTPAKAIDVDTKLRLFCQNLEENNGRLNLPALRTKAQQVVG